MIKGVFERKVQSLELIQDLIDDFFFGESIDGSHHFPVSLAVEELFTNMVRYNQDGIGDILLTMDATAGILTVTLTDPDADPFDIREVPAPDLSLSLQERPIGGLGLHLVREMVDELDYEHHGRETLVTFTRSLT